MKILIPFLLSTVFSANLLAATLCDGSCEFIVTFPQGGSIQATEALTLTFGAGGELILGEAGTVNTNPQPNSLDFSANGTLALAAGDSIGFGANGQINLGTGGNIDYSSLTILSDGQARLVAVGATQTVTIDNLVLSGNLSLSIEANTVSVSSSFNAGASTELVFITDSTTVDSSVCSLQDSSNGVTLSTLDFSVDSCSGIATSLKLDPATLTVGSIDPNSSLTIQQQTFTGEIVLTDTPGSSGAAAFQPIDLYLLLLLFLPAWISNNTARRVRV